MFGAVTPRAPGSAIPIRVFQNNLGQTLAQNAQGGLTLTNNTVCRVNAQQAAAPIIWNGSGYNTATGSPVPVSTRAFMAPTQQSTAAPSATWHLQYKIASGNYIDMMTVDNVAGITTPGGINARGINASGNSTFGGTTTLNGAVAVNNNAVFNYGTTTTLNSTVVVNGAATFNASANISTLYYGYAYGSYLSATNVYASNQVQTNYGFFSSYINAAYVNAGGSGMPASTVSVNGNLDTKPKRLTASNTLTGNEVNYLLDATNAAACTGTPSTTSCSSYSNYSDCVAHDSHGGCSWSGEDCGGFGDSGSCTSHSGCSWSTSNCADFNGNYYGCVDTGGCSWTGSTANCNVFGDYYSCISNGGCSWNEIYADCGAFNNNAGGCESTMGCSWSPSYSGNCTDFNGNYGGCTGTSGCSWTETYGDCGVFSNLGDYGTACYSSSGCSYSDDGMGDGNGTCYGSYDTGTGTCSGSYDNGTGTCSGTYDTGTQQCQGTYDPQTCSGSYGGSCSGTYYACVGTATCSGITNSTDCGGESGCSWTALMTQTLPPLVHGREYRLKNVTPGGITIKIYPYSGDDIDGGSELDLTAYKQSTLLVGEKNLGDCTLFGDEGTCEGHSGCSWNVNSCSAFDNYGDYGSACSSQSGCSWSDDGVGDGNGTCSGTYGGSCGGQYIINSTWQEMAARRGV